MRKIRKLIVHWSASGPATTPEMIRAWHKRRGWRDIGYHRIIVHPANPQYAAVTEWGHLVKTGRALNAIGAHTQGHNADSVGICVIAGPNDIADSMQIDALQGTLDTLRRQLNLSTKDVYGHRDFQANQCPGSDIYGMVLNYRTTGRLRNDRT
jgi:N-acetylmuramoyl-L-alanine amidase